MADKYILKVTAGPDYTDQKPIPINTSETTHISSSHLTANLQIRIQNYRGLPTGSPKTSPYFSKPPHEHDLYSLQFAFTPKEDINGNDLVFGNDFDHPIKDKLPPGFQQAFNMVKWFIDPGLDGDVYADEPYLYGPLLSSINTFRVGPKDDNEQEKVEEVRANVEEGTSLIEGADGDGEDVRKEKSVPEDAAARKKYFLTEQPRKEFEFEKGREYSCDFFNPYLDFNEFSLKLPHWGIMPGITIPIISYWDGQPLRSHALRYVLRNKATKTPLFVVVFTLLPKDEHSNEEQAKNDNKDEATTANDDDELD